MATMKCLRLGNHVSKEGLLAQHLASSRAGYQYWLGSGKNLMAGGITMVDRQEKRPQHKTGSWREV